MTARPSERRAASGGVPRQGRHAHRGPAIQRRSAARPACARARDGRGAPPRRAGFRSSSSRTSRASRAATSSCGSSSGSRTHLAARWSSRLGVRLGGFYACPHLPDGRQRVRHRAATAASPRRASLLRAAARAGRRPGSIVVRRRHVDGRRSPGARRDAGPCSSGRRHRTATAPARPATRPRGPRPRAAARGDPRRRRREGPGGAASRVTAAPHDEHPQRDPRAGFRGRRVLVVGEAILDSYLEGEAERLSREAPVPIVELLRRARTSPAARPTRRSTSRRSGAEVRLRVGRRRRRRGRPPAPQPARRRGGRIAGSSSLDGRDDAGEAARVGRRPDARAVRRGVHRRRSTGDAEDRLSRRSRPASAMPTPSSCPTTGTASSRPRCRRSLAELQRRRPRILVADARDLRRYRQLGVTAVKPNYAEACRLLGEPRAAAARVPGPAQIGSAGGAAAGADRRADLRRDARLGRRARLRARRPAVPHVRAAQSPTRAPPAPGTRTSPCSRSRSPQARPRPSPPSSRRPRHRSSSQRDGTVDLHARRTSPRRSRWRPASASTLTVPRSTTRLAAHRRPGRRIVFTNGCFDILHRGHVTYLARAKALGDVLVVGVNDDESVRAPQGPPPPDQRASTTACAVLEALSWSTTSCRSTTTRPRPRAPACGPTCSSKGGDYTRDSLPEAALVERLGGSVQILPLTEDRSTSGVIERVREPRPCGRRRPMTDAGRAAGGGWSRARRVLAIRLDAMGDVLMTTPALRAIHDSLPGVRVTLLTSSAGAAVARHIPEVDETIVYDPPWMKATPRAAGPGAGPRDARAPAGRGVRRRRRVHRPHARARSRRRSSRSWPASRAGSPTAARTRTSCSPTGSPSPSPTSRSGTRSGGSSTSSRRWAAGRRTSTSRSGSRRGRCAGCATSCCRPPGWAMAGPGSWSIPAPPRPPVATGRRGSRRRPGAWPARMAGASCSRAAPQRDHSSTGSATRWARRPQASPVGCRSTSSRRCSRSRRSSSPTTPAPSTSPPRSGRRSSTCTP